jgi:hypothetical protein
MTGMCIPFLVVPRQRADQAIRATKPCPATAKEEGEWPTNP